MSMKTTIHKKLEEALHPEFLEVINESYKHQGHAGDDGSGESHFRVKIRASVLQPLNRIQRHKKIYGILDREMPLIHALALEIVVG